MLAQAAWGYQQRQGEGDARTEPALSFQPSMRTWARRMIADIEKFFQRYAIAAEARGVEALASFHHAPFLHIHGDGGAECLPTGARGRPRIFPGALFGKYAERDHGGGRFLDLEVKPLGSAAALASLTWEQFKTDGSVYRRFRRSYNLLRINTDWKIVVTTAHRD